MGADKAFLEIEGRPMWERQLFLLQSLAPQQIFLAGPRRVEWENAPCEIIADAEPNVGPLGALVAGLRFCTTPLLLVLAVDLPRMEAECLRRLLKLCAAGRGVVPMTDRLQPLAAIYPSNARPLAEEQLAARQYSLQKLVDRGLQDGCMSAQKISTAEAALFLNANTPADFLSTIR